MNEQTLTRSLATDLDGSFEHLLILYGERVYRFALRSLGRPEDAEEVAQDTFVRAYRALADYPPERTETLLLRPWLYRIALNVVRNRLRRRTLEVVPFDGHHESGDREEMPELSLEAAERRREMEELLTRLPPQYRIVVVLRHIEGLGYREIADVLSQPLGTVKSNVHRGITMLRSMIEEEVAV